MLPEIDKLQKTLGAPLLEVVLENSPACTVLAEAPSGKTLYVNQAVRDFRGPTDAPLRGIRVDEYVSSWKILHPDGTPMKNEEMPLARSVLRAELVVNEELIVELDNGERRWCLCSSSPVRDPFGNTVAAVVSWVDITRYRTSQQQLEAAQSEIRTLQGLIPICAYCHKIRDDAGAWEQLEAYLMKHSEASFTHGICPRCFDRLREEAEPGPPKLN